MAEFCAGVLLALGPIVLGIALYPEDEVLWVITVLFSAISIPVGTVLIAHAEGRRRRLRQ